MQEAANAPLRLLSPIGDTERADCTAYVTVCNSDGELGISHGMHSPGRFFTDRSTTISALSSTIFPKLKYRGDLRDFEAWEKKVKSAVHALGIPLRPIPPTKEALKLNDIYANLNDNSPELCKVYNDACKTFNSQSTTLFNLIADAIDFSGHSRTHDLEWLNSDYLRDYNFNFSWGDRLLDNIYSKVAQRNASSLAAERAGFGNGAESDAVSGAQCPQSGPVAATSGRYAAQTGLPKMSEATADTEFTADVLLRFFQTGSTYFGGQVTTLNTSPALAPPTVGNAAVPGSTEVAPSEPGSFEVAPFVPGNKGQVIVPDIATAPGMHASLMPPAEKVKGIVPAAPRPLSTPPSTLWASSDAAIIAALARVAGGDGDIAAMTELNQLIN